MNKHFDPPIFDGPDYVVEDVEDDTGICCRVVSPNDVYLCTRNPNHPMPHAAHGYLRAGTLYQVWDDERSTDE
jgi:hypothetical protein